MFELIDTFPAYLSYWKAYGSAPIDDQIDGWRTSYMANWPELLRKQLDDYEADGFDWQEIARERIFPNLEKSLPDMRAAYANLLQIISPTLAKGRLVLDYNGDLVLVIYVGIGLGAGWATTYDRRPAILMGLENIADCGWISREALAGLVAHELGHLVHFHQRELSKVPKGNGRWWQLYSEGVAMRSEHLIMGTDTWHMRERKGGDEWLVWCRKNMAWLATEFLRRDEVNEPVTPFFGSWYDLRGYSQTGYFLGHELIRLLEEEMKRADIALLAEDDPSLKSGLSKLAKGVG